MSFERSETTPTGLSIPQGGKWAKAMLRLRSVPRDGAWYLIDPHGGRTTSEQTARKYNLALTIGSSSWEFGFVEHERDSQLWVRWIGSVA